MILKLYLLELEGGKFYVGQSYDPKGRFEAHLAGKGANWTRLFKPVRIREVRQIDSKFPDAMLYENWMTLEAMERFGWENVRGGDFLALENVVVQEKLARIYDCSENKIRYFIAENRHLLFGKTEDWLVYVLELEFGRFYIGSCQHLGRSLGRHFSGLGVGWTKKHRVVRVLELHLVKKGGREYLDFKHNLVLTYITKYGWENVMGGSMPKKQL